MKEMCIEVIVLHPKSKLKVPRNIVLMMEKNSKLKDIFWFRVYDLFQISVIIHFLFVKLVS